jgi:arylsulfatase A-like enzyme
MHAQNGFEELARVPLLIRFPDGRFAGTRVSSLAAMIDLMPTVLEILGITPNPEAQGRSLVPAVTRGAITRRTATIWTALRTDRWKYIPGENLLFDLHDDPGELTNLVSSRPRIVRELSQSLALRMVRDWRLAAALSFHSASREVLTEEERKELRALGYLR